MSECDGTVVAETAYSDCWVDYPLQRALGSNGVEGLRGFVQRHGVANGEAHHRRCLAGTLTRDRQHLRAHIDAHNLTGRAQNIGQGQRCIAKAATHVQEALALYKCEMFAFPRSKRSRRVPTSGAVHGPHEDRSVRIVIDTLVSQPMSIGNIHPRRLNPDPPEVRLSERRDVDPMGGSEDTAVSRRSDRLRAASAHQAAGTGR